MDIFITNLYNTDHYTYVFIDWNRDGDFDDTDEAQQVGSGNGFDQYSVSITVPSTATLGKTIMRIINNSNMNFNPCGLYPKGETEDYMLEIKDTDENVFASYEWSGPNSWTSTDQANAIANVTESYSGLYSLTVTNTYGCVGLADVNVIVSDPQAAFTPDTIYTMNPEVIILDQGTFDTYIWNTGATSSTLQVMDYGNYALTVSLNGCTSSGTINISEMQEIPLPEGWSLFSTYINNINSINEVMSDIVNDVIIVKNSIGDVYFPPLQLNTIGNLEIGDGYLTKMNSPNTLFVYGDAVDPLLNPIALDQYFNHLGYLRKSPAAIVDMMSPIISSLVLIKDYLGLVYWPTFTINQIGNMTPGQGYKIYMSSSATLIYPANSTNFAKNDITISKPLNYNMPKSTDKDMTIGIPVESWSIVPINGDEIAVFDANNNLVGASVFTGNNIALSIWGSDSQLQYKNGMVNDELFVFELYHSNTGTTEKFIVTNWIEGDGKYHENNIAVVGKIAFENEMVDFNMNNYPNPFSVYTTITFNLPKNDNVQIMLLNAIGEIVTYISNDFYLQGENNVNFDSNSIPSGNYFIKLSTSDNTITKAVQITK